MTTTVRWTVAAFIVIAAFALVFILDPTTCDGDICRPNALVDLGVYVFAVGAAILVVTWRRR
jgi:hypothetical protein